MLKGKKKKNFLLCVYLCTVNKNTLGKKCHEWKRFKKKYMRQVSDKGGKYGGRGGWVVDTEAEGRLTLS